jgi:flagellar biogenesis protein FliO
MLSSIVLLGLVTSPNFISEVTTSGDGGRVTIDIKADEMVDPEAASAKLSEGRLLLYLRDTRVRANNRWWGEGAQQIRAHRHKFQVELDIPLTQYTGCQGPVEFDQVPGGIRAVVACEGTRAAAVSKTIEPSAKRNVEASPEPSVEPTSKPRPPAEPEEGALAAAPRAATPPKEQSSEPKAPPALDNEKLKAALSLQESKMATKLGSGKGLTAPSEPPVPAPLAPAAVAQPPVAAAEPPLSIAAAAAAAASAAAGAAAPQPKPELAPTITASGAPGSIEPATIPSATTAGGTPAPAATANATATAAADKPAGSSSGGSGAFMAGALLLAIAAAAFYFARKRGKTTRYITIIETANLGPKRALVVARVGGQTMILGSSEAGITLLSVGPSSKAARAPQMTAAAPMVAGEITIDTDIDSDSASDTPSYTAPPAAMSAAASTSISLSSSDADEANTWTPGEQAFFDEGGDAPAQSNLLARLFKRSEPTPESAFQNFEQLLEDSLEDQELRRKLSLGMAGRVP